MRKLIVSEFMSLDAVMQAPGGKDEDRDGGFEHGGWTLPYWHDDIGQTFVAFMQDVDALLLGRRTYVIHARGVRTKPRGGSLRHREEVRRLADAPEADLARYDHHPRQRDRVCAGAEGRAREEHPDGRQQPAAARPAGARPCRRAAPARVSADIGKRQAGATEWRSLHISLDLGETVPERGSGASLRPSAIVVRAVTSGLPSICR